MKRHTVLCALLLAMAAALFAHGAYAIVSTSPDLSASLLYYEPVPAQAGGLVDVFVQIGNNGTEANDVRVGFVDNGPFTLEASDDRVKSTGRLPANSNFLVKYAVRVSPDAQPGTNYIKLSYSVNGQSPQTTLLPIDIFASSIALSVEGVRMDPELLSPGSTGTLSFSLRNAAQLTVTDGSVRLDLGSVDIIPVDGTSSQRFTGIAPGAAQKFSFRLVPSPTLEPGIYKVPLLLNFTDERGQSYSLSETVGMRVGAEPEVSVVVDDSTLVQGAASGDVTIRVTNRGIGEIKFVNLDLGPSSTYTLLSGSGERYIGNIDSDDYKTDRISVKPGADKVTIPVNVTYRDAWNAPHTYETTLDVPVQAKSGGGSATLIVVVLVLAVAIGGYFLYRRGKAQRRR